MTKIINNNYSSKGPFQKFVSKKFPPTEGNYQETHLQHRDGRQITYVHSGSYPKYDEIGWCDYCACVLSRHQNGKMLYGSTGQFQSYRNGMTWHPCPDCAMKVEKATEIRKQIAELKNQLDELDGLERKNWP